MTSEDIKHQLISRKRSATHSYQRVYSPTKQRCKYTALLQERAIKSTSQSFRITSDKSALSLLDSGE